jgi:hypothetical protein
MSRQHRQMLTKVLIFLLAAGIGFFISGLFFGN